MFGYQRGPAPLVALIRLLHRRTRYAEWADVDLSGTEVRLRRPFTELAPIVGS